MPASTRTLRWCETVGCERPTGSVSSHTHASASWGDTCPYYPGKRYEDWVLDDPAGQDINQVRPIRDQIRRRVESLINELLP
jgi:arsenate reductase (thioredoxin)